MENNNQYLPDHSEENESYESIYDMGNNYQLSDEECQLKTLAQYIINQNGQSAHMYALNSAGFDPSKDHGDKIALEAADDYDSEDVKKIIRQFTRKDDGSGYISKLKKNFNFDLDAFENNIRNKREKVKILYLLYKTINKKYPDKRIWELFGKPSMENIDTSYSGSQSSNGDVIMYLKQELEKEIELIHDSINQQDLATYIQISINSVSAIWDRGIKNWSQDIRALYAQIHKIYFIDDIINDIRKDIRKDISNVNLSDKKFAFSDDKVYSPVLVFYFTLLQYEYLGQIVDLYKNFDREKGRNYDVSKKYIFKFSFLPKEPKITSLEDINKFFDSENVDEIAELVYLKPVVENKEKKKIIDSKDKVIQILENNLIFKDNDDNDIFDNVDRIHIISCLQAILLRNDDKGKFDYDYYGKEGQKNGFRKGTKHTHAAVKNDVNNYDMLKIYWQRKEMDIYYANTGTGGCNDKLKDLEKTIYGILKDKIYKSSSIVEMEYMSEKYYYKISQIISAKIKETYERYKKRTL